MENLLPCFGAGDFYFYTFAKQKKAEVFIVSSLSQVVNIEVTRITTENLTTTKT